MERREFLLSAGGIVGATAIGSVAYTQATVERTITTEIAKDSNAIIGLSPGTTSGVYEDASTGRLKIDLDEANSAGLNSEGVFTYGDTTDPTTTYAFNITNNDTNDHNFTVSLKNISGWNFKIFLFDNGGTKIGEVRPDNAVTYQISASNTIYAIIQIDTSGKTDADSISGTIRFEAK
jgi:hypothetical protein